MNTLAGQTIPRLVTLKPLTRRSGQDGHTGWVRRRSPAAIMPRSMMTAISSGWSDRVCHTLVTITA